MARLRVQDVVKDFPAVRALDAVSLDVLPGEVHGIIGENGAGKSTLMKVLAGLEVPTSGSIHAGERPVTFRSVEDALAHGVAMVHQELNLVDTLTVAENICLGRESTRFGVLDRRAMHATAQEALARVGASLEPGRMLGGLSLAQKQLVEIAKALSYDAEVLIMDEPTAVLTDQETRRLFQLIDELRESGISILYISHRLSEVERLCDRVSVLRDGSLVGTYPASELTQEEMARLMVGRSLGELFPDRAEHGSSPDPPALAVRGLCDGMLLDGVTLEVGRGEIVGIAGLVGSGRTELAESIVGLRPKTSGSLERDGKPVTIRSPREAARQGIAYVSEDRKEAGLVLSMDVIQNVTLANLEKYARPIVSRRAEQTAAEGWARRLDLRAGDLRAPVLFLSGGNQQKVSIAKWLEVAPRVLILDEPTRGVDVGAKRELYGLVAGLAKEGLGCLVISSEMPELIGLCHRILVMREGTIVGEVRGAEATEEAIMKLAAGVGAA
jgi:ribose transport system ATP-binding protein